MQLLTEPFVPALTGLTTVTVVNAEPVQPQEFVAVQDSFGESGTPEQLMDKYKLNNQAIVEAVERVIKRK